MAVLRVFTPYAKDSDVTVAGVVSVTTTDEPVYCVSNSPVVSNILIVVNADDGLVLGGLITLSTLKSNDVAELIGLLE